MIILDEETYYILKEIKNLFGEDLANEIADYSGISYYSVPLLWKAYKQIGDFKKVKTIFGFCSMRNINPFLVINHIQKFELIPIIND